MDMFEAAVSGAQQLFTWQPLLAMALMLPIALLSGIMPGGSLPIAIVLLGFTGVLDPWIALTLLVFQNAASDVTQPVPAIMLGVPGHRSAQATILDGYPMARRGEAGVALGASYMTTLMGGLFGAVVLLLMLPIAREFLMYFGGAEFFLFSLLGVLAVAVVSSGALVKGLLTGAFGLAIAGIGFSRIGGIIRTDFGISWLWDGVPLVPVVIGLFALPEAIDLVVGDRSIAGTHSERAKREGRRDVYRGMRIAFGSQFLVLRSSLIGTLVGMLPGLGGGTAHWVAYAQARATEKGAKETFGTGDVRGVIASDAANNSSDGGQLVPTLVFGIPGSAGMAILLAMMSLYGLSPASGMLVDNLDLSIAFVYTIALANIVVVPVMLVISPYLTRITTIPPNLLAPAVIVIVTLVAFEDSRSIGLIYTVVFGLLGVFMKRYGWPRPPILIAIVLADTLERYLWISANTYGWGMFARPQFLVIGIGMLLVVMASVRVSKRAKQGAAQLEPTTPERQS